MIKTNRFPAYLAAIICISARNCTAHSEEISFDDIAKASFIVGSVGLSTWGALKILNWLMGPSDETVSSTALNAQREAFARYMGLIDILDQVYANVSDKESCINDINEQILYKLALTKYYDKDIASYVRELRSSISSMEKQHKKLHERIKKLRLEAHNNAEYARLYHKMKAINKQIEAVIPRFVFLHKYLKHHESYFTLFQVEDKLMYKYERDLETLDTSGGDILYARELMHQTVMVHQRIHHEQYPYRWYLKQLEDDIYLLHRTASALAYEYTERYKVAYALVTRLETIRSTIIGSPYYIDELRAIEHAQFIQATQGQADQSNSNHCCS